MSEARNQRFEIDIDEIEKQLRRSVQTAALAKADPLAELARIVGQDDPFRDIFAKDGAAPAPAPAASNVHVLGRTAAPKPAAHRIEPVMDEADRVFHDAPAPEPQPLITREDAPFDPVSAAYGSHDAALANDTDMQPLRPRRSRGRLAAVMAALLVTAGAVAGGLYWRKGGTIGGTAGAPPVVVADRSPLKVAPENPGGVEVPNQNRQIYERGAGDTAQSRVVDGREQPIDVREAARSFPPATPSMPPVSGRQPVASSDPMAGPRAGAPVDPAPQAAAPRSAVASALGEPRRVRTVAVKPDGTTYTPTGTSASVSDATPSLLPGNTLPPPVPVSTVPVSGRAGMQQAAIAPAPAASQSVADAPAQPAVTVLPPARPKLDRKPAAAADDAQPTRTASVSTRPDPTSAATEAAAAPVAGTRKTFSVQIAVRPSEDEARQAYTQLQEKFSSDLDGKSARVMKAEVNGKTVHRVRVGPMSKDDADGLCSRLKASGGSCFVAGN